MPERHKGGAGDGTRGQHTSLPTTSSELSGLLKFFPTEPEEGSLRSYQRAQEGADRACRLAEGTVLLEEERDELMSLWRALQGGRRLHLGRRRQLPEQSDLHLQHILSGLLFQPLVQLVRVPLAEPAWRRESHRSPVTRPHTALHRTAISELSCDQRPPGHGYNHHLLNIP